MKFSLGLVLTLKVFFFFFFGPLDKSTNFTSSTNHWCYLLYYALHWPAWYVCINNSFQFFLKIRTGDKIYKNTYNVV